MADEVEVLDGGLKLENFGLMKFVRFRGLECPILDHTFCEEHCVFQRKVIFPISMTSSSEKKP